VDAPGRAAAGDPEGLPMKFFFALIAMSPIIGYLALLLYHEFSYDVELATGKLIQARVTKKVQSQMELEFPSLVEVFSILISGGMSPSSALELVGEHSQGEFSKLLKPIIAEMKDGLSFASALDALTQVSDLKSVRRFADSLVIAVQRGTGLSDVVTRQVEEIRTAQRLRVLEKAGKAEIALMIPVVFLILPISILFALWPSYYGLSGAIAT